MVNIISLRCPGCTAPIDENTNDCAYCGTVSVFRTPVSALNVDEILDAWRNADLDRLREAAERSPIDAGANYALGIAYARKGLFEDALQPFRRAADKIPENPDFQYAVAATCDRLVRDGDPSHERCAGDRLKRAQTVAPRHVPSLRLAIHREARNLDFDGMVKALDHLTAVAPAVSGSVMSAFIAANADWARQTFLSAHDRVEARKTAASIRQFKGFAAILAAFPVFLLIVILDFISNGRVPTFSYALVVIAGFVAEYWIEQRSAAAFAHGSMAYGPRSDERDLLNGTTQDPVRLRAVIHQMVNGPRPSEFLVPKSPPFPEPESV